MIPVPPGWRYQSGIDMFTLVSPEGPEAGVIKYRERNRPFVRLGRLVGQQLSACPHFTLQAVASHERLTTREGEHAALIELLGRENEQPAARILGVVFGDDFYAVISALCERPDRRASLRALVRELVLDDSLGLGVRRRRYEYAPPEGWQPLPMGFVTEWFPPGFPADLAILTAYAANVRQMSAAKIFDLELERLQTAGRTVVARPEPEPCAAQRNLKGHIFAATFEGAASCRKWMAIFEDDRYLYPLDLTVYGGEGGEHHATFLEMAQSIRPIPPGATEPVWLSQTEHWTN